MVWQDHHQVVDTDEFVRAVDDVTGDGAVAVSLTDLDGFGAVNERLGREAGDAMLAAWTRTLTGSLPEGAIVRRLGGDEFAVALPGASAESAVIVLGEIREHLAQHPVEGVGRPISATFGVAARPPHATSTGDLVRCANAALMRGKREGGGRIALYVEEKMVLKSNYYPRADLDRLARLSAATGRTEASLLREALDDLFGKHREER
ncbi:MAG TPA: GGDEF domain-containing protein [Acidimicrobiales bacterium]|nr:GGDEF domain-containing protein [Acidimicrobiales bacterium]